MLNHLDAHVFDLPVQELRRGYRSDIYFWREKIALENGFAFVTESDRGDEEATPC